MSQPSPLTPARQRAQSLADSGDLTGAIALLERAVELGKVNLAEDDPDVLRTALQLGGLLRRADDPSGARRVLENAYAAGLWRLGDSDALMLEISHDIGAVAEELGNRLEARKAFSRVAQLGPATLGAGHPAVTEARAYLGQEQIAPVRPPDPAPASEEHPTQAVRQPGAPPAVSSDEPTTAFTAIPRQATPEPVVDEPTASFAAEPARAGQGELVRPPATGNQQVWSQPPPVWGNQPPGQAGEPGEAWGGHQGAAPGWGGPEAGGPQPGGPQATVPGWGMPQETAPPWGQPAMAGYPQPYSQKLETGSEAYGQKRGLGVFAAIAAVLAALIAVAALVFVLANRAGDKSGSDVPTLAGDPPGNVRIKDAGTAITVTWSDPAGGKVSFLVAMAHPGEQLKPVSTLGPGKTIYEITGLSAKLNYCFAVVAVYRDDKFATSQQACTNRPTSTK
ncbi:tetratricopeptide repeat protein [Actinoplanes sp. CA-030573]|uniref:fibronectin type III domain-containing protein n=1 Tax=Actinoplanes sp. CA-030573 TaxID=3239898 RepID=UPI003D8B5857